jgi:hypothetical protein
MINSNVIKIYFTCVFIIKIFHNYVTMYYNYEYYICKHTHKHFDNFLSEYNVESEYFYFL